MEKNKSIIIGRFIKKNFKQKTDAEHINELYSLIDSKLNNYLISDKRIGLFLSSGTDSSSLASYISNKIDYKLDTFTYDFDDADSKEGNQAK